MTEMLRPPIAGTLNTPFKYISGYASRQRNSVGSSIYKLLTRFFEFATACGTGNGSYSLCEPARSVQFDTGSALEYVFYGNGVPQDCSTVLTSLSTLLGSCPYFIWSDPYEARRSAVPNIMYSPDVTNYLSELTVEKKNNGLVLKGVYMSRQSETSTHAYPFKAYFIRFGDYQSSQFSYQIACGGHLQEFYSKILEFHKLRIVHDNAVELMRLEYLHRTGPVYLTRGRKLMTAVVPEININSQGMNTGDILSLIYRLPFVTREAVQFAREQLPINQLTMMYAGEQLNAGTERFRFGHADYMASYDTPVKVKTQYIEKHINDFLTLQAVAPPAALNLGTNWGISHLTRLSAIDNTFNIVEEKIKNAVGSDYSALVPEDQRMIIIPKYLMALQATKKNILYMSETLLEQDFRDFVTSLR